jgi:hypothetical protein
MAGCFGDFFTKIPVLAVPEKGGPLPDSWYRYGAYYLVDDFILSVDPDPAAGIHATEFTVYKKIRILNQQGARFATIPVIKYSSDIVFFTVDVRNQDSQAVAVDSREIQSKFEETGKVVVPQANPGSTITLKIVFQSHRTPVMFEHWFVEWIPVERGRFVANTDNAAQYSFVHKVYGNRAHVEELPLDQYGSNACSWEVRNIEPIDSLPFRHRTSDAEPRVALRVDPLYNASHDPITTWRDFSEWLREFRIKPALSGSSGAVAQKAKELTRGLASQKARADTIVQWVQKNIMCDNLFLHETIGEVLKKGKSDLFLVALLCREMLDAAGVNAELVLTRPHTRGGFDPKFMTLYTCGEGLVIAHIDGKPYGIYPVYTGYPVGTYPTEFFGLCGLDVQKGDTVRLPAPLWTRAGENSRVTLRLHGDTAVHSLCQTFWELSTCAMRHRLAGKGEAQLREIIEKRVRKLGERNSLVSFSVKNISDLDAPLVLQADFRSGNPPVEMAGALRYDLSPFLERLFNGVDSMRTDDIVVNVPARFCDTVEIIKDNAAAVQLDAAPWQRHGRGHAPRQSGRGSLLGGREPGG